LIEPRTGLTEKEAENTKSPDVDWV